jgi:hypothetical protein
VDYVIHRLDIVFTLVQTDTGETRVDYSVHQTVKVDAVIGPMVLVTAVGMRTGDKHALHLVHNTVRVACVIKGWGIVQLAAHNYGTAINVNINVAKNVLGTLVQKIMEYVLTVV